MRKKIYKLIRENNGLMKKGNNIVAQCILFGISFVNIVHILFILKLTIFINSSKLSSLKLITKNITSIYFSFHILKRTIK